MISPQRESDEKLAQQLVMRMLCEKCPWCDKNGPEVANECEGCIHTLANNISEFLKPERQAHRELYIKYRDLHREAVNESKRKDEVVDKFKELIGILDTVEESDSGIEFHPTTINSCRTAHILKLGKLIPEIKSAIKVSEEE